MYYKYLVSYKVRRNVCNMEDKAFSFLSVFEIKNIFYDGKRLKLVFKHVSGKMEKK